MAEQKQPFRFRLPWLSAATPAAPPASAQPTRPPSRPQPPPEGRTQANTSVPIQRPPFRPAGIAQVQPPPAPQRTTPQGQNPPRTEPEPPLQPKKTSGSQPASPSGAKAQTQGPFQLPRSPPRSAAQPIAVTLPSEKQPESKPAPQQSSPRTANDVQSLGGANSQPLIQPATDEASLPRQSSTQSQQQKYISQDSKATSEMNPISSSPTQPSFKPDGMTAKYSQESGQLKKITLERAAAQKPDPISVIAELSPPPSKEKLKETEERKNVEQIQVEEKTRENKAVEESRKEKIKGLVHQEPNTRITSEPVIRTSTEPILRTSAHKMKHGNATHPKERKPVGEATPFHKEIRENISNLVHKVATGESKHSLDEGTVSVITLAGENRGASMHIGSESHKTNHTIPIHRGYKLNPKESSEATTDADEISPKSITEEEPETKTYINSNAQSINNSIVLNSSVVERNPGVQLELSHYATQDTKSVTKSENSETRKSEFNCTQAQKLTYEPVVKRRCLRGLFMEPDDSDPDDHTKPRRHGCRYNSCEKGKSVDLEDF
ncbi:hypothetical protein ACFE04_012844 [Oxalis oulophora]